MKENKGDMVFTNGITNGYCTSERLVQRSSKYVLINWFSSHKLRLKLFEEWNEDQLYFRFHIRHITIASQGIHEIGNPNFKSRS